MIMDAVKFVPRNCWIGPSPGAGLQIITKVVAPSSLPRCLMLSDQSGAAWNLVIVAEAGAANEGPSGKRISLAQRFLRHAE